MFGQSHVYYRYHVNLLSSYLDIMPEHFQTWARASAYERTSHIEKRREEIGAASLNKLIIQMQFFPCQF